jgi:hypothetical protein
MRAIFSCLVGFLAISAASADDAPPAADPYEDLIVWQIDGLDRPESAYVDVEVGVIYLSQIVGAGDELDGEGYISKVSLEGEMLDEHWVGGLNAPKGIRAHDGTLYVSDIDAIVAVDMETAEARRIPVEGATFLNDVATGPDGGVFSSDMRNSRIIAINRNDEVSVLADSPRLECPNGLLVHDGRLIVGGWASEGEITDTAIGHLYSLDFDSQEKTLITPEPTGNLDGIEIDGHGGFIVSDWKSGKILHITDEGEVEVLMELTQGAADHAYLPDRHWLILPRMMEGTLVVYDIGSLLD